jgi:large subunit ribosomal protein L16
MLFTPKRYKYKKHQKGALNNACKSILKFSEFLPNTIKLVFSEFGSITTKQLVAIRFLIKKCIKKKGFVRFCVFPQKAISKKPLEIRMGKGKGNISHWAAKVCVGSILCKIIYKQKFEQNVLKSLNRIKIKIPLKVVIIKKLKKNE